MHTITQFTLIAGAGFALRSFPAATFVSKVTDNLKDHYSDRMNIHDRMIRDLTVTLIVAIIGFADSLNTADAE